MVAAGSGRRRLDAGDDRGLVGGDGLERRRAPTAGTGADIFNGGTATVTTTGDVCGSLFLGNATDSGAIEMTGGGLVVGNDAYVAYLGDGTFFQSGGTHTVGGQLYVGYNGEGAYTLTGTGTLAPPGGFPSATSTAGDSSGWPTRPP